MDDRMRASRSQEQRGARQHNGRVQPGSGSGRYAKGDVKSDISLIEYKMTSGKTIRLDSADLTKHRERALVEQKIPFFGIEVGNRDYIVIDFADFEYVLERRAKEIAGDIVQQRLGNAGSAESDVQPASEMQGCGDERERPLLSSAREVPEDSGRKTDDSSDHGRGCEGFLPRPKAPRGFRVPRPERVPRMESNKLAAPGSLGGFQRAGAAEDSGKAAARGRVSKIIGSNET